MRELLERLEEATLKKDREIRNVANDFHKKLTAYIEKHPEDVVPVSGGGFKVYPVSFWNHPRAADFTVLLAPRTGRGKGGIGKVGSHEVLVLNVLKGAGDLSSVFIDKNVVVHEMVHFLDPGRDNGGGPDISDDKKYYNDPSEWNAFWQEGADKIESTVSNLKRIGKRNPSAVKKVVASQFGDGTIRQFPKNPELFWDNGFLGNMTNKTRRKFDKRLYQLFHELKREGLWD